MRESTPRFAEPVLTRLDAPNAGRVTFTVESAEEGLVVHCAGYLDIGSRRALHDALFELVRGAPIRVIVDLSAVPMLDASAIGELVGVRRLLRAWGGQLRVQSPSTLARRVLDICDLGDLCADDERPRQGAPRAARSNANADLPRSVVGRTAPHEWSRMSTAG